MYPEGWPRCPKCNDFALDGHITCGRFECNEHQTRRDRDDARVGLIKGGKDADSSKA